MRWPGGTGGSESRVTALTIERAPVTTSFVIKGASVLDAGGGFSDAQDIVIEDGVVLAVGSNLVSDGQTVIDLAGLWLMPGVFDCHMHVTFSTVDTIEV